MDYTLNTGDRAFIRRENDDAQGRIELMALFIDEDDFYAETDRTTFAELQRTAIGYSAFTGRIEPCYGATSERTLSSYPAPNARSILCVRDGGLTAVALLADLTYTNYSAPAPARPAATAPAVPRSNSSIGRLPPAAATGVSLPTYLWEKAQPAPYRSIPYSTDGG